jgi:3-isopropylmalate dehydrogenase
MKYTIALLAGDGIGPEVINEAVKVSNAIAKNSIMKSSGHHLTGACAIDAVGVPYPDETRNLYGS